MSGRPDRERFLRPFEGVPIDVEANWHFRVQYRELADRGELIGSNDLWTGATALAHQLPLATCNVGEFGRVRGLQVLSVV